MRRSIAMLIMLVTIGAFAPLGGVAEAGYTPTFCDVPTTHPFYAEIEWLANEGITEGFEDACGTAFRPGTDLTRQAMAAFLYRYNGSPNGADPTCTTAPFPDVPTSHPFCGEIQWALDNGLTNGFEDGEYKPARTISRQALMAFLYRQGPRPGGDDPLCLGARPFPDVPIGPGGGVGDDWLCGEIEWAKDVGIGEGFPDGTFRPVNPVTRQAFAAFLFRFDDLGFGPAAVRSSGLLGGPAAGNSTDTGNSGGTADAGTGGNSSEAAATSTEAASSSEASDALPAIEVATGDETDTLPVTGSNDTLPIAQAGIVLVMAGGLLVAATFRRRPASVPTDR